MSFEEIYWRMSSLHYNPTISDLFNNSLQKYKSLVLQCKQCGVQRKDEHLVLSVLSKLGLEYSIFVSTFHFGRASIPNWKIPSLDAFIESLIQEQYKLVQMGVLQTSKNQALLMSNSNNVYTRGKHKGKDPKSTDSNPKEINKSSEGASGSKKKKKFKKTECPFCIKGFHPESQCMKKQIDQLSRLLKHNHISLPQILK